MKNKNKIKITILVLGIVFALSPINSFNIIDDQGETEGTIENRDDSNLKPPRISGYWTTNFIHIDGNWSQTEGSYSWCSGDGSWSNPYTIENVTIDASTSPTGSGIFINNSKNEYFIINNVTVYNVGSTTDDAGIKLENTSNGTLINNNCSDNGYSGLFLSQNCNNNTLSGNTANNNDRFGIYLQTNCDNNLISGNSASNVGTSNQNQGIVLYNSCDNNTISGNTANSNTIYGINLQTNCDNNIISGNTASNIGAFIQDTGIIIWNDCDNNIISGNTANDNSDDGIYLLNNCNNNTILGNTANGNFWRGIWLENQCDNNTISGNTANDNGDYGIYLLNNCNNNTILGNTANGNTRHGIYLGGYSNNNIISGNTVSDNDISGIRLFTQCDNNTITENIIYENNVGIQLEVNCFDNLLVYNCIFNNSNNNGFDSESNNWDNGVIGNYWGNYTGIDANHDGIGDTPYNVPGGGGNKDNKPIMNYNPFFFKPPDDLLYEIGTEDHNIKWTVINTSPLLLPFNILREGTSVKTGRLFNYVNDITIDVGSFDEGTYGFIIEVEDEYSDIFTDVVWVTITNTAPEFTVKPNDISYEVGETGNNFSWTFSDVSIINPTYTITRNSLPLIIDDPCISGEAINISTDDLGAGSYCFEIEIDDGYGGTVQDSAWVTVTSGSDGNMPPSNITNLLFVEIINQSFSIEEFNFTFSVYNGSSQGIDFATIQLWWDGAVVSSEIQNLGSGLYFVPLDPITVAPGEEPILLNMIISADGYQDKYFYTYLTVDPDTLDKEVGELAGEFPLVVIIIASTSIAGGIGVVGITIFLLRKRKRLSVSK